MTSVTYEYSHLFSVGLNEKAWRGYDGSLTMDRLQVQSSCDECGQVVRTRVPLSPISMFLVLAKGRWCSAAGTVITSYAVGYYACAEIHSLRRDLQTSFQMIAPVAQLAKLTIIQLFSCLYSSTRGGGHLRPLHSITTPMHS